MFGSSHFGSWFAGLLHVFLFAGGCVPFEAGQRERRGYSWSLPATPISGPNPVCCLAWVVHWGHCWIPSLRCQVSSVLNLGYTLNLIFMAIYCYWLSQLHDNKRSWRINRSSFDFSRARLIIGWSWSGPVHWYDSSFHWMLETKWKRLKGEVRWSKGLDLGGKHDLLDSGCPFHESSSALG